MSEVEREREKERKQLCVGCKKKFTKSDYSVMCGMCSYWYHKACAGVSDDVYKCIETHCKDNPTFWNCTPCSAYARGITARMRELEGRIESVEKRQDEQDGELANVNRRVDDTNKGVERLEKKIEEECTGANILNELRERKARRQNIILYGVGESDNPSVEERRRWDKQSCINIFKTLKLHIELPSIKYVRRIGEKGDRPRPLLAGMSSESEKDLILDNARLLRDSRYKNVGLSADLTPMELKEEKELVAEAARRNANLSQEDREKNLQWLVVGQKGTKRLIKGVERAPPASREATPLLPPTRAAEQARNAGGRGRLSSKRGHSASDSDGEAPSQHGGATQKRRYTQRPPTPTGGGQEEMHVDSASQPLTNNDTPAQV